jgi:hypothetical protein
MVFLNAIIATPPTGEDTQNTWSRFSETKADFPWIYAMRQINRF